MHSINDYTREINPEVSLTDGPVQARFAPGLIISEPSFVVDLDGNTWWVRPASMVIVRAEAQVRAETSPAPNNKPVAFGVKPTNELAGAAKKSAGRKRAKHAAKRGMISEKAAKRHLGGY